MSSKGVFIDELERLLKMDDRSDVDSLTYIRDVNNWPEETVVIKYNGGLQTFVNVTGTSKGAILIEIAKEIYGEGAQGRFFKYFE
ncbi:MAG: hypothetical protein IIX44_02220 [Clostridia bacterium]|nr:hypothetical protein [Clostridia bacterium]